MEHTLKAKNIVSGYNENKIVDDVTIDIPSGKISVILGSNGSGKSTLLKTIIRLIKPMGGHIELDGKEISKIHTKTLARVIGLLPQTPIMPGAVSITELVSRGRYPHRSFMGGWKQEDTEAVARAIEMMGLKALADKNIDELSGGQRQRAWIAMALAQDTDILFLDEPTTYLDITHQIEILDLLVDLNKQKQTTIVMVLHDINLAARYAHHLFAMKKGKLITQGAPDEILTEEMIKQVFDLECLVIKDPITQTPLLIPKGRHLGYTRG